MHTLPTSSIKNLNTWSTSIFHTSPIIKQLKPTLDVFESFTRWPTIEDYSNIFIQLNSSITPVPQAELFLSYEDQYEPRVYLKNELQTRTNNWHDFFNATVWLKFPKTKKMLNQLHYNQSINRQAKTNRTLLENRLTQFDECGAIIISNDEKLLDLIRNHQWKELFIHHRQRFENDIRCVIFGHAIFEKALNPYIGLTCHCLLFNNTILLDEAKNNKNSLLDTTVASIWKDKIAFSTDKFQPFPLLGLPGYWLDQDNLFYSNKQYFR